MTSLSVTVSNGYSTYKCDGAYISPHSHHFVFLLLEPSEIIVLISGTVSTRG